VGPADRIVKPDTAVLAVAAKLGLEAVDLAAER
jgi:hypothetical protein